MQSRSILHEEDESFTLMQHLKCCAKYFSFSHVKPKPSLPLILNIKCLTLCGLNSWCKGTCVSEQVEMMRWFQGLLLSKTNMIDHSMCYWAPTSTAAKYGSLFIYLDGQIVGVWWIRRYAFFGSQNIMQLQTNIRTTNIFKETKVENTTNINIFDIFDWFQLC